ncbi:hypothetical protein [Krasilnikovia sp. MM14-A1259]|uniref:hypothetical protein n=1 Tax=Krasilnikovia sp. MM14-A1259 TaxID=3373539 RepID=UPI00399CC811
MAGPMCTGLAGSCGHDSCASIRRRWPGPSLALEAAWLSRQVEWLRKHQAAAEAFEDLHRACEALARLVDRPPDKDLVGMCDCGKVLYAPQGADVVRCPESNCRLKWNVAESRGILRKALDGRLVTAAEAARLGQYLDTDRTQEQIRKLINAWASRHMIAAHGQAEDDDGLIEATYRFGDISDRLARTPRRSRQGAAA